MKNTFCHVEIPTIDPQKCRDFYANLFTWKVKEWGPGYWMVKTGSKEAGGGIWQTKPEDFRPGLTVHVLVKSVDETLAKVESLGGKIIKGKTEVMGEGWFALVSDPDGSVIGIFEALKKPKPKKAKPQIKKKRRIKR